MSRADRERRQAQEGWTAIDALRKGEDPLDRMVELATRDANEAAKRRSNRRRPFGSRIAEPDIRCIFGHKIHRSQRKFGTCPVCWDRDKRKTRDFSPI